MTDPIRRSVGRTVILGAVLGGLAGILGACDDPSAGGTSDQGNALAIVLRHPDGRPAAHAQIRVRADSWTPGAPLVKGRFADLLADSLGQVTIDGMDEGTYVVEAMQDSLVGSTGRIHLDHPQSTGIHLERGSSIILRSSDPSATGFALRGLSRVGTSVGDGRFEFRQIPTAALEIETRYPGRVALNLLPPLRPGSLAEVIVQGDSLRLDSGALAGASIATSAGNRFEIPFLVELVPTGLDAIPERRLDNGDWALSLSSVRLDSTFGAEYRLRNGTSTSHPQRLRWNLWDGKPKEIFDFAADGTDTTGFPNPTLNGASRLSDTYGSFLRLDSTQSIDWGLALMDSIPQGAVEIRFRPGPGFQRGHAYSLFSNDAARIGIGYLRGMLYFVKGANEIHRWVTSRPNQLLEGRWYDILATWGPQGATLSVDGNLVGWSADVSGYSPGSNTVQMLSLRSGAKTGCCLEPLGIVSPQRLDGDIASIHIYDKQPILWSARLPHQCADSVAGDLRARCGESTTPRDFEILH